MAKPVYVGGTSGVGTSSGYTISLNGTLTGGIGTSPQEGDIVVVFSGFANTASSAPAVSGNSSGAYQAATAAQHVNDTWDTEFRSFYQKMGATPDTTLTITRATNTAYGGATVVQVWRGCDPTNPFIGAATPASGTNGAALNPPAYNPAVTDSIIIAGGAGTMPSAGTAGYTGISGMSNTVTRYGDGTTADISVIMASYEYAGASYDPATATGGTQNSTSSSWAGVTLALRPVTATPKTTTTSLSAAIKAAQSATANVSAAIRLSNTATASLAAVIATGKTATASLSAAVQAPASRTASLSAAIRAQGSKTASLSAAIRLSNAATASVSAAVRAPATRTTSLSAAVRQSVLATANLSAAVRTALSASASLSAMVEVAGQHSVSTSLSAAVREARVATASLSSAIAIARTAVASVDAAIRLPRSASASASAAISQPRTASTSASAAIRAAFVLSASLSAAIQRAGSASASLSAYILDVTQNSRTTNLSAAIRETKSASTSVSAVVREQHTATASLSAVVAQARSATASLGAAIAVRREATTSLSAAVKATRSATAALTAYINAETALSQTDVDMITDIWRRFGLDAENPLVQEEAKMTFGPVITLSGTEAVTSTRTGATTPGPTVATMLLDIWQRLGLDPNNPMTVSASSIVAGGVSQTMAEGTGTVTVTRQQP